MTINLTVLMPVYNGGKYLAEAIEGVLKQDYKNFELLIVNDSSTDDSLKIALEFANKDSRIKVVSTEKNLGLAGVRNYGFSFVKTKYLAFHDADDISVANRFSKQINFLESHQDYIICGSKMLTFGGAKSEIKGYGGNDDYLKPLSFFINPFNTSAVMLRFDVLRDNNIFFDTSKPPAEDYSLWLSIFKYGKWFNFSDYLIKYRIHGNQTSHKQTIHNKLQQSIFETQKIFFNNNLILSDEEIYLNASIASGIDCDKNSINKYLDCLSKIEAFFIKNGYEKKTTNKIIKDVFYVYISKILDKNFSIELNFNIFRKISFLKFIRLIIKKFILVKNRKHERV
ncbi:MAG: glycosyltransferase family 2 protein [Patescibacteria group bacterium]|nr:glycosyltransferase family 2 protein [Patescibacteria group bacterium]